MIFKVILDLHGGPIKLISISITSCKRKRNLFWVYASSPSGTEMVRKLHRLLAPLSAFKEEAVLWSFFGHMPTIISL